MFQKRLCMQLLTGSKSPAVDGTGDVGRSSRYRCSSLYLDLTLSLGGSEEEVSITDHWNRLGRQIQDVFA